MAGEDFFNRAESLLAFLMRLWRSSFVDLDMIEPWTALSEILEHDDLASVLRRCVAA